MHAETAYVFRHALYRDAAYQLQPPADRAGLHELALELIEALLQHPGMAGQRGAVSAELADHALAARQDLPDRRRCEQLARREAAYLHAAADYAMSRYQYDHALRAAERGLRIAGTEPAVSVQLREAAAQALAGQGRFEAALPHYAAAGEAAAGIGDTVATARNLIGAATALFRCGRFAQSESLARQALADGERRGDLRLQALAWQCLGKAYEHTRGAQDALEATQRSLHLHNLSGVPHEGLKIDLALRLASLGRLNESNLVLAELRAATDLHRNPQQLARVLSTEATNAQHAGQTEAGLRLLAESTAVARSIGAQDIVGNNELNLGMIFGNAGRHEEAMQAYARAEAIYRETGALSGLSSLHNNRATTCLAMGLLQQAEQEMDQADILNRRLGRTFGLVVGRLNRAALAAKVGDFALAAARFESVAEELEQAGRPHLAAHAQGEAVRAWLELKHADASLRAARRCLELLSKAEIPPDIAMTAQCVVASAFFAAGRGDEAKAMAHRVRSSPDFANLPADVREKLSAELVRIG